MNDNGWVKLFRKAPYDSKLRSISAGRRWVFVSYLCAAEPLGKWRGYLVNGQGTSMSARQRADVAGIDHSAALRAERELIELGLLQQTSFGLKIKNYAKYQGNGLVHRTPDSPTSGAENTTGGAQNTKSGAQTGAQNTKSGAQTGAESANSGSTLPPKNKEDIEGEEEGRSDSPSSHPIQKHPIGLEYRTTYLKGGMIVPIGKCRKAWAIIKSLEADPEYYQRAFSTTQKIAKAFEWVREHRKNGHEPDIVYSLTVFEGLHKDATEANSGP